MTRREDTARLALDRVTTRDTRAPTRASLSGALSGSHGDPGAFDVPTV